MISSATREMEGKKVTENTLRLYRREQRRQLALLTTRGISLVLQTNLGLRKLSKTAVSFRESVIPMRIHNKGKKAYTRVDVGRSRVKETQAAWVE